MNALRQHLSRNSPKQGEHTDMPGIHSRHRGKDQNHKQERGRGDSEQPQCRTGIGVNHVAMGLIEYRHRIPSPAIVCQLRCSRPRPHNTNKQISGKSKPAWRLISAEIFTSARLEAITRSTSLPNRIAQEIAMFAAPPAWAFEAAAPIPVTPLWRGGTPLQTNEINPVIFY